MRHGLKIGMAQRQHQRAGLRFFVFVDLGGDDGLQFAKAFVQFGRRCGTQLFQLLYALKNLRRHAGTERAHTVGAEGMITAQRVFKLGHGFLKLIPCRKKELETMVQQRKVLLGGTDSAFRRLRTGKQLFQAGKKHAPSARVAVCAPEQYKKPSDAHSRAFSV